MIVKPATPYVDSNFANRYVEGYVEEQVARRKAEAARINRARRAELFLAADCVGTYGTDEDFTFSQMAERAGRAVRLADALAKALGE
jgi:hypothetical protein